MIYKQATINNNSETSVPLARFGNGTIGMVSAYSKDFSQGMLFLASQDREEVGTTREVSADEFNNAMNNPDMVWHFSNIESVDAVIKALKSIKRAMIDNNLKTII